MTPLEGNVFKAVCLFTEGSAFPQYHLAARHPPPPPEGRPPQKADPLRTQKADPFPLRRQTPSPPPQIVNQWVVCIHGEGYVFKAVCHSVHNGVWYRGVCGLSIPHPPLNHTPSIQNPTSSISPPLYQIPPLWYRGGVVWRGVWPLYTTSNTGIQSMRRSVRIRLECILVCLYNYHWRLKIPENVQCWDWIMPTYYYMISVIEVYHSVSYQLYKLCIS